MALPPWTVELLRRGVADLARQVSDPDMVQTLKDQTARVVEELPRVAREKVDSILRAAESGTAPLRSAWSAATLPTQPSGLINASGQLDDPLGNGIAVAPEVLAAGMSMLSGAVHVEASRDRLLQALADRLSKATGTPLEVIVTPSFESALSLLVPMSRRGGTILVPRCCAKPVLGHDSAVLADQLRDCGATSLREIGSADGLSIEALMAVVAQSGRSHCLVRLDRSVCSLDAAKLRENNVLQFVVMPHGRMLPSSSTLSTSTLIGAASDRIMEGADGVVLCGGVWTGTPELGLLIARSEAIKPLLQSPHARLSAAPPVYIAMLDAAIKLQFSAALPIDNQLIASEGNINDRADRLATQISGIAGVSNVRVTHHASVIRVGDPDRLTVPSVQVAWGMEGDQAQRLISKLRLGDPIVLTRQVEGTIALDLRFVTPDQQSQLHQLITTAVQS